MKITLTFGIKQVAIFIVLFIAVLATSSLSLFLQSGSKIKKQTIIQPAEVLSEKTSEPAINGDHLVKVTRVIDGDTIEIEGGQKVRYIGIDTPETVHPDKSIQCFGNEASDKNKELVEGKSIRLEKDVSETDKYGRLLRYVYLDSTFVNKFLVEEGYAYSSTYPPDVKYQETLNAAQQQAQLSKKGLWSSCSTPQSSSQPFPTSVHSTDQSGCIIKGNISSSGEKIYHIPAQNYYDRTIIDESKGERWFCSEEEAISALWRKSKQ